MTSELHYTLTGSKAFIKQGMYGVYSSKKQALWNAAQLMNGLSKDNYDALKVQQEWNKGNFDGHEGFNTGLIINRVFIDDDARMTDNGFPEPLEDEEVYYDPEAKECF